MDNRQDRRQYITDKLYKAGWKGPDAEGDASSSSSPSESKEEGTQQPNIQNGSNGESGGERERRLALLPLDRNSGAESVVLKRQKAARRKH